MSANKQNFYYSLNDYCMEQFGEKVYRLSLNGGMTCPNRDGTLDTAGCAFCSAGGSGDFASDRTKPIAEQLSEAKERIRGKTNCKKFIAYFQAYTNTYAPVSYLRRIFTEAMIPSDIAALSIATRSDCLSGEVLALLEELNQKKPVWVELGLQTVHNRTHQALSTHTTVEMFSEALHRLTEKGITVIAHLILGLPGETPEMIKESVSYIAHSPVSGVKLQLLHILKNTPLSGQFQAHPFPMMTLEEYCDLIIDCVELLPPDMVIHRLTGDGPRKLLIAPLWSADKKRVLNTLHRRFRERGAYQGRLYFPD